MCNRKRFSFIVSLKPLILLRLLACCVISSYLLSFQQLQRYGFTLTTKVCGPNRVDIFRNVRYNRNDRTKSLALRRKSTTRTLSDRLSAKKQQSVTDLQHKYKSCLHDPQPYHNEMPHPLSPSPFQCTGNNQSIHVTDDNLYRTTEIDAFCPTPFPISYAFPFPNPVGDHFSRNHKVGVSLVDVWNAQQAQGNASTSKTETIQEAVGHSAVPLYPVMPDQEGQPLHLTLNDEPDKWSPGVEDTTSPKIHRKESSLFEDSISLSANAIPSIGNSEEDELSDTSPSSDWISTYSSFHSILEDFGTRPELEKSLDEEIMDSIFD